MQVINLRELSGKCTSRTFLLPEAPGGLRLNWVEEGMSTGFVFGGKNAIKSSFKEPTRIVTRDTLLFLFLNLSLILDRQCVWTQRTSIINYIQSQTTNWYCLTGYFPVTQSRILKALNFKSVKNHFVQALIMVNQLINLCKRCFSRRVRYNCLTYIDSGMGIWCGGVFECRTSLNRKYQMVGQ